MQDYTQVLDLIQDIILATDLAHHLGILTDLERLAVGEPILKAISSRLAVK